MNVTGVVRTPAEGRARLGSAIVAFREQVGLTQEEFAALCNLSLKTIQRIELGRVTPTTKTYNGLDHGAGWSPGTARGFYDSGARSAEDPSRHADGNGGAPSSAARQRILALTDVQLAERVVEIAEVQGVERAGEYLAKVREIRQEADRAAAQRSESPQSSH